MDGTPLSGRKVAVAMSGGVDSSVAALLLDRAGAEVIGITARHFDAPHASCCSDECADIARAICDIIGARHVSVDLRAKFEEAVIRPFCAEYLAGRTPNPCVECNRRVRFGILMERARGLGAELFATGHHVRLADGPEGRSVLKSRDPAKDQSYYFWWLGRPMLDGLLMPVGGLLKDEVRELAREASLPSAEREESQDVCFITDGRPAEFIAERSRTAGPGPIHDSSGKLLGEHAGLIGYTVGQRRGLGLAAPQPLYVTAIRSRDNALIVGPRSELMHRRFRLDDVNIIDGHGGTLSGLDIMTRYRAPVVRGTVSPDGSGRAEVVTEEPAGPLAPGQSVAFYVDDRLIGGGIIADFEEKP